MILEDWPYQTRYFAKIFLSLLALTLQIHFPFIFTNNLRMRFEQSYLSQVQPLVHPKVHSKLHILWYFWKTWLNIWRKSWWSSLLWCNRSILQIFIFSASYIFCYWGQLPSHAWLERNGVYEAPPVFFSLKHFRLFVFVKNYCLSFFQYYLHKSIKYKWK